MGTSHENIYKIKRIESISFNDGKGLYEFNKITKYETLRIFSGAEDQVVSCLTKTATENVGYDGTSRGELTPENLFPNYPWKLIKDALINKFVWFGRLCSIAIGIYSIFLFIEALIFNVVNCIFLKKIGSGILNSC